MSAAVLHHAHALAGQLPPLLVEAERVAQTVYQGVHGRRRAGVGETFWQFRPYAFGDAAIRIDWRQSARTDRAYVREREWEAAQSVYMWADASGSMDYASTKDMPTKAIRARLLMLALASLLVRGGEKAIWLDEQAATSVGGKAGLERIAARLQLSSGVSDNHPPAVPLARHAHVVLCSDFLMQPDDLQKLIQRYAALNMRGAVVHVLDPAEEQFTFDGRVEMKGCEGEDTLLLPNATSLRDAYLRRMAEHRAHLQSLAVGAGWSYIRHSTAEQPHLALMQLYQNLAVADRN